MSMSRDGLLPPIFARIHPKYKTPSFSTILTGVVVGVPALFMNLNEVVNLTSVGTLFAFVLVCGGILKLQSDKNRPPSKYKTPYINSKWIIGLLFIGTIIALQYGTKGGISQFFNPYKEVDGKEVWVLREKVPYYFFALVFVVTSVLAFLKNLSLIPVMGFLCCSYLLCESGTTNWERFLVWLVVGLALYFVYGRTHSKLAKKAVPA
jgi:amino acid transporter